MDHMEFKYFGEYELFKPRQISERRFKQLANSFLISKCGIREYCDPTIVNEISASADLRGKSKKNFQAIGPRP